MNERSYGKVKAYIEKYRMISSGDVIVAGVSGGADSVCLLLMLYRLAKEVPIRLVVVHVNHGIRNEAKEDASYTEQLCKDKNIPFYLIETDVRKYAKENGLSEEEAGRKIRYEAFERILKELGEGKIAVAHNANDRAETMLFHLFRGTGLSGASGIKPVRGEVIRPLLCLSREEIEDYLKEEEVAFCTDDTNREDIYTRNRIRNHILPYAEENICHGAVAHMWDTADMLLEAEEYIGKEARKAYENCLEKADLYKKEIILNVDCLIKEDELIQKYVILKAMEELTAARKDITSAHILSIIALLNKAGTKQISLPYGLTAVKEYNLLKIGPINAWEKEHAEEILLQIPGSVFVPGLGKVKCRLISYEESKILQEKSCTKWFDYDKITKSPVFRTRQIGDFLTINVNLSKKSLKEYMIGEKIPKNIRSGFFILADGSHIMWVPGHRISQYYKVTETTNSILEVQLEEDF